MARKQTTPKDEVVSCAVCGRTLLRGEHAEVYIASGSRRKVCELCSARATHQGWIREDASLEPRQRGDDDEQRRPLRGRLFARRGRGRENGGAANGGVPAEQGESIPADAPVDPPSEPDPTRQVHAVPTSGELKAVRALELFNGSEHPRTVAGVARSLGAPAVSVRPVAGQPAGVAIIVAWELCWYRYEVDLADGSGVRLADRGYELSELEAIEQERNAAADEHGTLAIAAA